MAAVSEAPDGWVFIVELQKSLISELHKLSQIQTAQLDVLHDLRDGVLTLKEVRDEIRGLRRDLSTEKEHRSTGIALARTVSEH
jgi:hypothetical protein